MTDQLSNASIKNWLFFAGAIALTTIVVAALYGWIYGFNYMAKSIQGAGNVLTAAFVGPAGTAPQPYVYQGQTQTQGAYVYQPAAAPTQQVGAAPQPYVYQGQVQTQPQGNYVYQPAAAPTQQAGQFVCPQHGAVGMPIYGQGGIPLCPICGQIMQLIGTANPVGLAAWNNPGGG